VAIPTTLSGGISSSVTTIPVNTLTGTWPNTATGPFVVTVDRGTASEEKILVPSYSSTQFTGVTRGYDGTTAVSHSNGGTVEHTLDATQIDAHDAIVYAVGAGTPSTSGVGDSASNGTNVAQPAAGDHKHGRESFATSAGNSAVGDAEAAGSSASPSRGDHKHGRESFYASAGAVSTSAGAAGSSASPAHGDHVHQAGGELVGVSSYAPGSGSVIASTTSWAEVNAALRTTFTAPASGEVLARLTACVGMQNASGDCHYTWALGKSDKSVKYGASAMVGQNNFVGGSYDTGEATTASILVTGLTPGTSYTFAWFHIADQSTVWDLLAADDGGSLSAPTAPSYKGAPAVMEIWAV